MEVEQVEITWNFAEKDPVTAIPKISLHPTGQAHVKLGDRYLAGPLSVPPFEELGGEHIATVAADDFANALPVSTASQSAVALT